MSYMVQRLKDDDHDDDDDDNDNDDDEDQSAVFDFKSYH